MISQMMRREEMTGFAVTAMDWFNAYRRHKLEPMISLYNDQATLIGLTSS
jgi:hypothetical protein